MDDLRSVELEAAVAMPNIPEVRVVPPVRINLLPHRERRRQRLRKEFSVWMILAGMMGCAVVFAGGTLINRAITAQQERNDFISQKNAELDREIDEVKVLRDEIAGLRARQKAVEDLQSERTIPVHLFDELARIVPEALVLQQVRQDDKKLNLSGVAQSNERVAELLHNLAERSPWLERPELGEISESGLAAGAALKDARRVYAFSLNALIKNSADQKAATTAGNDVKPAAGPPVPASVGPRVAN